MKVNSMGVFLFGFLGFWDFSLLTLAGSGKTENQNKDFVWFAGKSASVFLSVQKARIYMCVHSFRACTLMESCMLVGNRHGLLVVVGSYHVR